MIARHWWAPRAYSFWASGPATCPWRPCWTFAQLSRASQSMARASLFSHQALNVVQYVMAHSSTFLAYCRPHFACRRTIYSDRNLDHPGSAVISAPWTLFATCMTFLRKEWSLFDHCSLHKKRLSQQLLPVAPQWAKEEQLQWNLDTWDLLFRNLTPKDDKLVSNLTT